MYKRVPRPSCDENQIQETIEHKLKPATPQTTKYKPESCNFCTHYRIPTTTVVASALFPTFLWIQLKHARRSDIHQDRIRDRLGHKGREQFCIARHCRMNVA
jgi:hypothetical protein